VWYNVPQEGCMDKQTAYMTIYLNALKQRRQLYYDYSRLDYDNGNGTNVLTPNQLYKELGDEIDTIIHELSGFVKVNKEELHGNQD
jgi:hypothetical protein